MTIDKNQPKSLCIVMLGDISETIHILPVANTLKRTWPQTKIAWVIQSSLETLVQGHPAIDDFITYKKQKGLNTLIGLADLSQDLKKYQFDIALIMQSHLEDSIIAGIIPAKRKIGFDATRTKNIHRFFTNEKIPIHTPQHIQEEYFEFLNYLNIDTEAVEWDIHLSDEERKYQDDFFQEIKKPVSAVVVGTDHPAKNWTAEGYASLLEELEFTHGLQTILIAESSPIAQEMAEHIMSLTKARPLEILGSDFRRILYILDISVLTVSPDTGLLHISRALETPVVGLYGYTNPKRYGPYRRFYDLVVDGYAEFPGEEYPISMANRDGMGRITKEMVMEKVELAIEKYLSP